MSDQNPITMERFTLVVTETGTYGERLSVKGKAYGKYEPDTPLYIKRSSIPVVKLDAPIVSEGEDGLTEIIFESKGLTEELKYAVVTNVEPQGTVEPGRPVENPFLLGLARAYKENYETPEFTNELCFNLVHANFIMAVYSDELGTENGKVKQGTQVGFPMLTIREDRKILPVFTDWAELRKWENVFDDKHQPKCIVMGFDNATEVAAKDCDGMVVNPFSTPVPVPQSIITDIKNSEGYKSEKNVTQKKVEKDTPIQIGIPQESEQIKLAKEALKGLGDKNDQVKEIYLFAKRDANDVNLLTIFDLDYTVTEEERREIFDKAYQVMIPAVGRKTKVEFAMKAPAFIKLCSNFEPLYKA